VTVEERVQDRLRAGDRAAAATEAIRGLGPKVVGYLRALLRDEDDVADAFSQWAEDLWKGLGGFRGESSFRTWALRLAWNAGSRLAREGRRKRERRLATGEVSALADSVRTSSMVRFERRRRWLAELRDDLSPEEQTLLFLRVDQELSWTDVASVLSASGDRVDPDTACKRFERLKVRLGRRVRKDPGGR
jgi:RNA polymerase sigma-70 factor (ECF subfamily)